MTVGIAAIFLSNFAGRTDDHVRWSGDHWERAGAPLTPETLIDAFAAKTPLSTYFSGPAGTSHVAAVDFDTSDGWNEARRLRDVMDARGAFSYIEPSRRGAHLWSVLDAVIPTATIRRALRVFLADAGIAEDPKIELRPSHDGPVQYGAPLRLPTMHHPKTAKRYPLCGPDDRPLGSTLADILLRIELGHATAFAEASGRYVPRITDIKPQYRRPFVGDSETGSASAILAASWGAINAAPGHTIRCPAHDDRTASLSVLSDDQRAVCKSPSCELNNNDRGRGIHELTVMSPAGG